MWRKEKNMLDKIKQFFLNESDTKNPVLNEEKKRLASAALLIEVAIIDQEFDQAEFDAMQKVLETQFGITAEECQQLISLAQLECEASTSTYQFTQLINQYSSAQDKVTLITGMWSIAYADGDLDKYEEYIIRKVADLLYVSHSDFIHAKHTARSNNSNLVC